MKGTLSVPESLRFLCSVEDGFPDCTENMPHSWLEGLILPALSAVCLRDVLLSKSSLISVASRGSFLFLSPSLLLSTLPRATQVREGMDSHCFLNHLLPSNQCKDSESQ